MKNKTQRLKGIRLSQDSSHGYHKFHGRINRRTKNQSSLISKNRHLCMRDTRNIGLEPECTASLDFKETCEFTLSSFWNGAIIHQWHPTPGSAWKAMCICFAVWNRFLVLLHLWRQVYSHEGRAICSFAEYLHSTTLLLMWNWQGMS